MDGNNSLFENECIICKFHLSRLWAEKNSCNTYQCLNCGFVYTFPVPNFKEMDDIYNLQYFDSYDPEKESHDELYEKRLIQYKIDVTYILKFISCGKVLDFGCGNGKYLEAMPDSFEKIGYEFNPKAVDYLKKKKTGRFYTGEFDKIPVENESLDLITMRGVIEHLPDPVGVAKFLTEKLKRDGYLIITATPNVDSSCATLYKDKWNLFYPPEHLNYFSARTLSLLWARFGLYCIDVYYPYIETPYANTEQDSHRWLADSKSYFLNNKSIAHESPPFVGNMLSIAFKKKWP